MHLLLLPAWVDILTKMVLSKPVKNVKDCQQSELIEFDNYVYVGGGGQKE